MKVEGHTTRSEGAEEFWVGVKALFLAEGVSEEEYEAMMTAAAENLQYILGNPAGWTDADILDAAAWICAAPELAQVAEQPNKD